MMELSEEKSGEYHSLTERLKNKAVAQARNEQQAPRDLSLEGLGIIAFWVLVLALNMAGWYLLIYRFVPFLKRWFRL